MIGGGIFIDCFKYPAWGEEERKEGRKKGRNIRKERKKTMLSGKEREKGRKRYCEKER